MKSLFVIPATVCGKGTKVICAWHPSSVYLAIAGGNGGLHIFHRDGNEVDTIPLSGFVYYFICIFFIVLFLLSNGIKMGSM
jgi:alpha-amylase/alpha-mannosidase (GH57 family)